MYFRSAIKLAYIKKKKNFQYSHNNEKQVHMFKFSKEQIGVLASVFLIFQMENNDYAERDTETP